MTGKLTLTAFGAAGEVGRSCFVLKDRDRTIALDCGIKLRPKQPSLAPSGVDEIASELDSVVLSHAHVDHSGYIPALFKHGFEGEIHTTNPTIDITYELWKDHFKIEGERHWREENLEQAFDAMRAHRYHQRYKIVDGVYATFYRAGHILGGAQTIIDWDGTLILYTGDINDKATPLFDGFELPGNEPIDIVITEATNGGRPIPDRTRVNNELRDTVMKAVQRKAKVVVPSFAIGRSQELEFVLGQFLDEVPVYVDGMIRLMNAITNYYIHPDWVSPKVFRYLKEKGLANPFEKENFTEITRENVGNPHEFRRFLGKTDQPAVILSTSGMMEGGPIHTHLEVHGRKQENVLAVPGYQAEGTLGRAIIEGQREIIVNEFIGRPVTVNLELAIQRFQYSGHASLEGIKRLLSHTRPKQTVLIHCDHAEGTHAGQQLTNGTTPILPKPGTPIELLI